MKRIGGNVIPLVIIIILLLVLGLYIAYKSFLSKNNQSTYNSTHNPQASLAPIDSDFPSLYSKVEWSEPITEEYLYSDSMNNTFSLNSTVTKTKNLINGTTMTNTITYYRNELKRLSWKEQGSAGGPNGENYVFEKNGEYFAIDFFVKSDSPLMYQAIVSHSL
ncbi:MAG: hypothetical protein UT39_C0012G0063 [Candidatus Woesebacteria bacterium GW2011_GWA1_39_21]|uniref:Uncharacterized protein n=1 Tax=Candidatus Woesebacteria bacterium GW2011_GWA1_39_21 TaxID=1618550 RepID=A0A0G0NDY9_9BACT|nr:MAG: hypothetical protein UT39_C0012G0063 [Candidatus Woesebacteria bacterium GW2011_GWA1_39_21]